MEWTAALQATGAIAAAPTRDLTPLFEPRSVAVVGASGDLSKWGGDVSARLMRGDHRRAVYLVNGRGGEVLGRQAYASLRDLPEAPELVILAMPAKLFEDVVGNRFELGRAVLDGQAVDGLEDDLATLHLRLQKELQHPLGLLGDVGSNTVAAANADDERVEASVVDPFLVCLHPLDTLELLFEESGEVFFCFLDCFPIHLTPCLAINHRKNQ